MRPRLLDLFCCAGGAGMGYHRAGFEVVGVDIDPQPNYPFEFHQADALTFSLDSFDVVHASPPCQRYTAAAQIHDSADKHPDLIAVTRDRLTAWGGLWVIENVERSPLVDPIKLCGSMFGLGVRRHRLFESPKTLVAPPCGDHSLWYASVFGNRCVGRQHTTGAASGSGKRTQTWDKFTDELATARLAMGIDWMTLRELSESIPPAYAEHLGRQFIEML